MIKDYLKSIGYMIFSLIVTLFLLTLLNYFNIISGTVVKVIGMIIMYILLFITGYMLGNKGIEKGYLIGIKYGSLFMVIVILINLIIFKSKFTFVSIVYYLSIILTTMVGSILGIQKK